MSKGEMTRERVIGEATRLINTRGIGATSVSDLLEATGVAKGSLYYHFPAKQDLGVAVLERAATRFMAFLDEALSGATPGKRLTAFLDAVLVTHREAGFVGGCIFGNIALEMGDSEAVYGRVVREVFDRWAGRIEEIVAEGQSVGEVRDDLPADRLADHIVAAVEGGIMLSRLKKDGGPLASSLECLAAFLRPPKSV